MIPEDINSIQEIKSITLPNLNDSSSSTDSSEETVDILDEEALVYQGYEILPSTAIENNDHNSIDSDSDNEPDVTELPNNLEQYILQILDSNDLVGFGQQIVIFIHCNGKLG